jgi:DNA-binding XRE family transcriptional regulator
MKDLKRKKLKAQGWAIGTAADFLGLTPEEAEYVRMKFALARLLAVKRHHKNYTQSDLASRIGSSQSRVAKLERGDPSVSMDLLVHSLFALGATRKELARAIGSRAEKVSRLA